MKKIFLIFGMAGYLSLFNGINNANAVQSQSDAIVQYNCPEGCELKFSISGATGQTFAWCERSDGSECHDPEVNIFVIESAASNNNLQVSPVSKTNKVSAKKKAKVSARSAETPKMVKKIVYEQIVEEDEE